MAANGNAPVIIKRKKVVSGGGHHGGAWKVAYADFVTAMMAFFLLMWLLNATTEKQRKGLADHFSPAIPINRSSGGGDGALGGDSIFTEETLSQSGIGASSPEAEQNPPGENDASSGETENFRDMRAMLQGTGAEALLSDTELPPYRDKDHRRRPHRGAILDRRRTIVRAGNGCADRPA